MLNSRVLYGWMFSFGSVPDFWNGFYEKPDFWNGICGYDYTIRYVDKDGRIHEVGFNEVYELVEYVRKHNIVLGNLSKEVYPPDMVALKNYTYQYFENDVLIRSARPITRPWVNRYNAVDKSKHK